MGTTDRRGADGAGSPAPPAPDGGGRWSGLYASGPPGETGVGTATVRRQRRRRHRLLATGLALLVVLGAAAFVFTPRWWWSPKAYVDHLGYGPYEGEMPADLRQRLAGVLPGLVSFVERERGLRFAGDPAVVFLPDQLFRRELDSHLAFQQRYYVAGPTYDALGWPHRGDRFDRRTVDLTGREVVSLYGDWDGTIYLRGHDLTPLARLQLVGMLTQSLDDQTYNLAALYGPNAEQDERTAYDALVAGDSRFVQQAYLRGRPVAERCGLQRAVRLPLDPACPAGGADAAPDPVAAELRFADDYGLRFVTRLRAEGGTAALGAAFRHPPRSTADVMSLPHYRTDRAYRAVDYPPHTGRLLDFGTLGAYTLSLALAGGQPAKVDAVAVTGWRGDSFSTYRPAAGRLCVTDTAVFDTPAQARAFAVRARAAADTVTPGRAADTVTTVFCHRSG